MRNRIYVILSLLLILSSISACDLIEGNGSNGDGPIQGSGTVEAVKVIVSSEIGGRVAEVMVKESESVDAGVSLFRLEDDLLQAQRDQALAALNTARANLEVARRSLVSAQVALDSANIQLDLELNAARLAYQPQRRAIWSQSQPDEFVLPVWYFDKSDQMSAAEAEVQIAQEELDSERQSYETVLQTLAGDDLLEAEERLAYAQTAYLLAQDLLERASTDDNRELEDEAQAEFDFAESELEAAQTAYQNLLSDEEQQDMLDARARLALAEERHQAALDRYNQFLSGEDSLRIKVAAAAVNGAEANLEQVRAQIRHAETTVEQAQTQLDLIDVQIKMLTILAPVSGVVISRQIQPGEIVQPGASALTLGQLDDLSITVYIPEDRYGQINLAMPAAVAVDSFPGETFLAEVVRIADQAEFTPRNVQTEEGRRTTVFAVELSVQDPAGKLKPGMPADVTFQE